jgi:hypothetical protein
MRWSMACTARWIFGALASVLLAVRVAAPQSVSRAARPGSSPADRPAEDTIGERLFLDTRFAQFFAAHMTDVNEPLAQGDPAVATVPTLTGELGGPFAGESVNCRSCHFVAEFLGEAGGGNRTYADFARRSRLPRPQNGFTHTPRNAMQMVGSVDHRNGPSVLHSDGEFANAADLVKSTIAGRNFGWAPEQYREAIAHIARVIREDDGSSEIAKESTELFSYGQLFLAADPQIPPDLRIPRVDRMDVKKATNQQILALVAKCIALYMEGLRFQQDAAGGYIGSPYDLFLKINLLPNQLHAGETPAKYARRLRTQLEALRAPKWVDDTHGQFRYHAQPFKFGPTEFAGLLTFLRASGGPKPTSAGNCAACHPPPRFTDFAFHNTGISQEEYDGVHGDGSFVKLEIPGLRERAQHYDLYLPQTRIHPSASERLRHEAVASHPEYADLGLWNVYLNPDMPAPQPKLRSILCGRAVGCADEETLRKTLACFRTPTLRDLEDSDPYFHNGSQARLENAVEFYLRASRLAQGGKLRNPPREFQAMSFTQSDVDPLVAFLVSLTENYDDK